MTYQPSPPPFFPPPLPPATPRRSPAEQLWPWVLGSFLVLLLFCLGGGTLAGTLLYQYGDPVLAAPIEPPRPAVQAPQPDDEEWPDEEEWEDEEEWADPEAEPPIPEPLRAKDGKKITITGPDGERFEVTAKTLKLRTTSCDPGGYAPDGGSYLLVDLKVKVLKGTATVNPFAFYFFGDDESSELIETTSGCDDLGGLLRPLKAGKAATARMAFDVSTGHGELELMYRSEFDVASWRIG